MIVNATLLAANKLLASLDRADRDRLIPHFEHLELRSSVPLHEIGAPVTHVYFPVDFMASMVVRMADGDEIESGTIGNEGIVGVPALMDGDTPFVETFVQIPGSGLRMPIGRFQSELARNGGLAEAVSEYTRNLLRLIVQSSACNLAHSVRQRCARMLLVCSDSVSRDTFRVTQEFLSELLAVRRASVTVIAGKLKAAKLLSYRNGVVTILDREGLERVSCECYRVIRAQLDLDQRVRGNGLTRSVKTRA
jgi:CRP-like cAMP-binding protein